MVWSKPTTAAAAATCLLLPLLSRAQELGCIGAAYHLEEPTALPLEGVCSSFSESSCCSTATAAIIEDATNTTLYNFDYSHCGPISKQCEVFLQMEECFYECSPDLLPWAMEGPYGPFLQGVPICGNFCDEWFDACRFELTCATDWLDFEFEFDLDGFLFDATTGQITCSEQSECLTFEERYGNGEGLCNSMWASSFTYSDQDECLVFADDWQSILAAVIQEEGVKECIGATHHLQAPVEAPEIASTICSDFSGSACCSLDTASAIDDATDTSLYNFNYAHCGPISKGCEAFLQIEECFYECSPDLSPFASPGEFGPVLDGIPICAEFCDAWYAACKDDLSCSTNWLDFNFEDDLDGFVLSANYEIYCAEESECLTYEQRYGSGEALCNMMWDTTFAYSTGDDECFVMSENWQQILLDKLAPEDCEVSSEVEGDANGDEVLDILDVVLAVNFILKQNTGDCAPPEEKLDINSDGIVNVLDVVDMINTILGLNQG